MKYCDECDRIIKVKSYHTDGSETICLCGAKYVIRRYYDSDENEEYIDVYKIIYKED